MAILVPPCQFNVGLGDRSKCLILASKGVLAVAPSPVPGLLRSINFLVILPAALLLALALGLACGGDAGSDRNTAQSRQSDQVTSQPGDVEPSTGDTTRMPSPDASAQPTADPVGTLSEPLMTLPPGYYHGVKHGLALAQTSRRPSVSREGWVDITVSLVAVRQGGGLLDVERGESNSLCFSAGEDIADDCFLVQWGSQDQFEAELHFNIDTANTGMPGPRGPKSVGFTVTFEVAGNADSANIYFNEHKIPLDLQGDHSLSANHFPLLPAPTPPPSQDAKTAGFFVDTENAIAVTGVYRDVASWVRVELEVLSLGDYAASDAEGGLEDGEGGICFGKAGNECLEIFWGPENQFNAMLSLDLGGKTINNAFAEARQGGANWPLPLRVWFRTPHNQDNATLIFGEHSIPIDLRGMTGSPAFDYTAHYPEAKPGALLYEVEGKTVVLDSITQDPATGDLELALTARNDNEAEDFIPALDPVIFSATGKADVTDGDRTVTFETMAPGQSASLTTVVPRGGNAEWGYVAYSSEAERRPDGVVLQVRESGGPHGQLPGFVRFDRTADEGKFWPVKWLWSHTQTDSTRVFSDGKGHIYITDRFLDRSLDPVTGEIRWEREHRTSPWQWSPSFPLSIVDAVDGVVVTHYGAFDAANGNIIWEVDPSCGLVGWQNDGVAYGINGDLSRVCAMDAATGEVLWTSSTDAQLKGEVYYGSLHRDVVGFVFDGDGVPYLYNHFYHADKPLQCINLWSLASAPGPSIEKRYISVCQWEAANLVDVAGGVVYLSASEEGLVAKDAATGEDLWSFAPDRCCSDSESTFTGVVADGVMYGYNSTYNKFRGGQHYMIALDATTGEELWRFDLDYRLSTEDVDVTVSDGTLYVDYDGDLIALNAATGEERWRREAPDRTEMSYMFAEGVVYAMNGEDILFALDAATGEQLWDFHIEDGMYDGGDWWDRQGRLLGMVDGVVYAATRSNLYAVLTD